MGSTRSKWSSRDKLPSTLGANEPKRSHPIKVPLLVVLSTALALISASPVEGRVHAVIWNPGTGVTDLGALAQGEDSMALGINDSGQVVGTAGLRDGSTHGFIWTEETGMVDIGTPGGTLCIPSAINASGAVAGHGTLANGEYLAFYWTSSGGFITFPESEYSAYGFGINDSDSIAGYRFIGADSEGYIWKPKKGKLRKIGFLPQGDRSKAVDINNLGHVAGYGHLTNQMEHIFLWTKSDGITDLGTPEGVFAAVATEMNDSDEIVGHYAIGPGDLQAFHWSSATGYRRLEKLNTDSPAYALGINNLGQIVGFSSIGGLTRFQAVLWNDSLSAPLPLDTLPAGSFSQAWKINNLGQVVGWSDLNGAESAE